MNSLFIDDKTTNEEVFELWDGLIDDPIYRQKLLLELLLNIRKELKEIKTLMTSIDLPHFVELVSSEHTNPIVLDINGHEVELKDNIPITVPIEMFENQSSGIMVVRKDLK